VGVVGVETSETVLGTCLDSSRRSRNSWNELDENHFSAALHYIPGYTIVEQGSVYWGHEARMYLVLLPKLA